MPPTPCYTLLTRLGAGGMAEVLAALERGGPAPRLVAIKRILPNLADDAEVGAMFRDEAALAARIDHPNVCKVHGLEDDGRLLVMEYLEGLGLERVQRRSLRGTRGIAARYAVALAIQAAEGLHAAHELCDARGAPARLVHRDVSPANLFLTTAGVLKVLDFGIAKVDWSSRQTRAGLRRGKAGFMSPEQVRGLPLDRRSDVFSLGVVLWELLAGRPLFSRGNELDSMHAVLTAGVPGLAGAGVPAPLERVVRRALERDLDERWPTAAAFATALADAARATIGVASAPELGRWLETTHGPQLQGRRIEVRDALRHALAGGEPMGDETTVTDPHPVGGEVAEATEASPAPALPADLDAATALDLVPPDLDGATALDLVAPEPDASSSLY